MTKYEPLEKSNIQKVIFLDIDGVLNDLTFNEISLSNTILKEPVDNLNEILLKTDASIVLSSSWRYLVHGGSMTLKGVGYLLATHGVIQKLCGITLRDEDTPPWYESENWCRSKQIEIYLKQNPQIIKYVVLDDFEIKITNELTGKFIQTNPYIGLTKDNADEAIQFLNG